MNLRRIQLLAAILALPFACAYQSMQGTVPQEDDEKAISELSDQLDATMAQVSALRAGVEADRCPRICDLADTICRTSDKICTIANRHPERPEMARRCDSAKGTCRQSRDDCTAQCSR